MDLNKKPIAIYRGFSSHDCETWHECTVCGKNFGSYSVHVNENNERCCPQCKTALAGLD